MSVEQFFGEAPARDGRFSVKEVRADLDNFPLDHPGGSIGLRLDWPGHSMAYVTDTTATVDAQYIEAIRGVDGERAW